MKVHKVIDWEAFFVRTYQGFIFGSPVRNVVFFKPLYTNGENCENVDESIRSFLANYERPTKIGMNVLIVLAVSKS